MTQNNILAGINIDEIGVGKDKNDILINITTSFNLTMKRLLILSQKYIESSRHMDMIVNIIKYGDKYTPSQLIHKTYKNLLNNETKKNIIDRNITFFTNKNYDIYIKKDEYKKPLDFLIFSIKKNFNKLSDDEIHYLWDLISIMLICADEYLKYLTKYNIHN